MNVIFPQLELVEDIIKDECNGCYFKDDDCDIDLIEKLTGVDCHTGVIFKKKGELIREWVTCTKENTNVGDKVRLRQPLMNTTIQYISSDTILGDNDCIVNADDCVGDVLYRLNQFEIEIVR